MALPKRIARPTEDQLHVGVVAWLRVVVWEGEFFHPPNGGWRAKKTASLLKRMGAKPGVPDLVFWALPRCPLAYVELKREDGRLSDTQETFKATCESNGVPYHVIKSDDVREMTNELQKLLIEWGAMLPRR